MPLRNIRLLGSSLKFFVGFFLSGLEEVNEGAQPDKITEVFGTAFERLKSCLLFWEMAPGCCSDVKQRELLVFQVKQES